MSSWGAVGQLGAMLALAGVVACTQTPMPAETSASLCNNALDDDGDALDDCADPDCWGHEICRVPNNEGVLPPPYQAPPQEPPAPPIDDVDATMPPVDLPDANMQPVEPPDAGGPKMHDAEVPSSPCGSDCPLGACSDAGVCEVGATPLGRFVVRSIEVEVPRGRALSSDTCFDDDSDCEDVSPFELCPCPPDPQVLIYVDGTKAGHVLVEPDTEIASWEDVAIELTLYEGSVIVLDVLDNDESTPEAPEPFEKIFECELTASTTLMASGELACEDLLLPPGLRRRVVAHIEALETPEE